VAVSAMVSAHGSMFAQMKSAGKCRHTFARKGVRII